METYYCVKRPGECDGTCDICPVSVPRQLEFDFGDVMQKSWTEFGKPFLESKQADKVNKPSHYTKWKIEPITYIMRNGMEFWRGNIIKYASRAGAKAYDGMDLVESEITDLEKVRRYAEMRINQLKGETEL